MKRCAMVTLDENIAIAAAKIHAESKIKFSEFGLDDAVML